MTTGRHLLISKSVPAWFHCPESVLLGLPDPRAGTNLLG